MANNATVLSAQVRSDFGKGASRRARRADLVPGVIYGHGSEPRHILLPGHDTSLALRGNANALIELDLDGEKVLVLTKDVQRHPIRPGVMHVDFVLVKRDEKVEVEVALVVVGEAAPGTMHMTEHNTVLVSAPAISIPESIEADITGVEAGVGVHVSDLTLPDGVEALMEADTLLVNVTEKTEAPEEEAPAAEEAATEEAPEAE